MNKNTNRAVLLGLTSALFFSFTYVLNRRAAVVGGHWAWTASLRYLLMLPMLALLAGLRGGVRPAIREIRARPAPWILWSAVGFVLFYLCLCWAAASGPSWLVAGAFQLTVIAGMLLAPLLYTDSRRRIPPLALGLGLLTVGGVLLMQRGHFERGFDREAWFALGAVTVASFCYPLGNRKLLLHLEAEGRTLGATQRLFGMTLASVPLWLLIAGWALVKVGLPSFEQLLLAFGAALLSGVVATVLFFAATGLAQGDPTALGAVEAMQGSEIVFAMLMGVAFLGESWPAGWALLGSVVVTIAIAGFTVVVSQSAIEGPEREANDRAEASLPPLAKG